MLPDYYQILGVAENATAEEIKKAYRQKAMKCHPDRGGSHDEMLIINEAFEILKNPESRIQYDYARSHQHNTKAQQQAKENSYQAKASASNYPRNWSDFEKWLNRIAEDFQQAEYGRIPGKYSIPTAANSLSGKAFICCGGLIGLITSLNIENDFHGRKYTSLLIGFQSSVHGQEDIYIIS